jgi:hypothetical protein
MPVCRNPECGRRFVSEGEPFCGRCIAAGVMLAHRSAEPYARLKAHLRKRRGVWQVRREGYYSTRLTTPSLQVKGLDDCVRLAVTWNAPNA